MKPVILLAFANAPPDGANYLRNLPEEERRIRAALEYAEAQGLCEFEVRANATLDDILAAFQLPKLRGRIAVFHYGGHADSYDLLFQSRSGEGQSGGLQRIDARGFAAFLAEQRGLQLVFLNACSTEPQIEGLLGSNVQAVIATAQDVDDGVAAELAGRFYAELAHGASIGASYRQAVAALRSQKGDDPNAFYAANALAPAPGEANAGGEGGQAAETPVGVEAGGGASGGFWPWLLRTRRGGEAAVEWSLPLAAGDPLFGLPPLPPKPLPDSPYQRALDYYTRDLAELFFGRGRQIRDLYQRVTAPGRSGVILYYGQSGVGKSSLLDAGLAPRLEATHAVLYARRDRNLSLLGTLHKQLAAPDGALLQAWLAAEGRLGKPVVLILDQVEEVFSRRNPDQPQELEELAAALGAIDRAGDPGGQGRPAGVLLLGFRKERLAEIETALHDARVDFAKLFLEPLDVAGIQEVFWGPVRSPRLRDKYGLNVEDSLPPIVAHDLIADPDSPVAPTLNILLRKLWAAATAQAASAPRFTVALYEQLRRDGILLDDFLRQQTATLAQEQPDAVTSGLLLDLWAFHTTPLGTSDQHTAAELKAAYGERPSVEALVLRSKELYVLADPAGDQGSDNAGAGGGSRLAHDTLAPLVRRDFGTSALPGQQARRLLESRAIDWQDGRSGPLLDDAALAVIDKGLVGMRSLSDPEGRLLAASKAAQAERARRQRLSRGVAAAAVLVVLALLAATFLIWENGRLQGERADRAAAESQAAQARAEREAAERQAAEERSRAAQLSSQLANERERAAANEAQRNESQRLAALAEQQLTADPVVGLQLALAALPRGPDQPAVPEAEYTLRQAVLASRERAFITTTLGGPEAVAIRGSRVAVGGAEPAVYKLDLGAEDFPLPHDFTDVAGLHWGNDGRLLGWSEDTAWVVGGGEPQRFALSTATDGDQIRCAEWQPAQQWVAICTYSALYAWQPDSGRIITLTTEIDAPDAPTERRGAAWSPDGRLLAGSGGRLVVWDSSQPQTAAQVFDEAPEPGSSVSFAFWLPDNSLLAGWFGPAAQGLHTVRWRGGTEGLEPVALEPDVSDHVQVQALYAPDTQTGEARLLLWSNDGLLALYDGEGRQLAAAAAGGATVNGVALSPDGAYLAAYAADGSATLYSPDDLRPIIRLDAANDFTAAALTGGLWLDNVTLLLSDRSGLLHLVHVNPEASLDVAVTGLAGYGGGERIAAAARVVGGRLLTAGYAAGGGVSSLRLWQAEPLPESGTESGGAATGGALPPADAPLCGRLPRALPLSIAWGWPSAVNWQDGDQLLLTYDSSDVAQWTIGGDAVPLPSDPTRTELAFAPDHTRLLRYGSQDGGEIWQWTGADWVQEGAVTGRITAALWSAHGLLVQFEDGSGVLLNPDSGDRRALPEGVQLADGAAMIAPDLLVALRGGSAELWQIGGRQPLAAWPVPPDRSLYLAEMAADGRLLLFRDRYLGQLYVLRADPTAPALDEIWRMDTAHVNPGPAHFSPMLPLLATVNDSVLSVVDLDRGETLWSSTSAVAGAGQAFLDVQWNTDGQYLITQAQTPQASSVDKSIGVWRWDGQTGAPVLLQEVQAAYLVGVRPDMRWLLASEREPLRFSRVVAYPIFTDIAQLRQEAPASCLLVRPLSAAQREAFSIDGR